MQTTTEVMHMTFHVLHHIVTVNLITIMRNPESYHGTLHDIVTVNLITVIRSGFLRHIVVVNLACRKPQNSCT